MIGFPVDRPVATNTEMGLSCLRTQLKCSLSSGQLDGAKPRMTKTHQHLSLLGTELQNEREAKSPKSTSQVSSAEERTIQFHGSFVDIFVSISYVSAKSYLNWGHF